MSDFSLTPELFELIAERFRALGEPSRLQILNELRGGERTVGELVDATGLGQANVSRHLQRLFAIGYLSRRKEGLFVYYRLSDETVFRLCDIVCGRMEAEARDRRKLLST